MKPTHILATLVLAALIAAKSIPSSDPLSRKTLLLHSKRQAADDHDHNHDVPSSVVNSVSATPSSTPTPIADDGHHDHDHDTPSVTSVSGAPSTVTPIPSDDPHDHLGHSHEEETNVDSGELVDNHEGHSHGPARVCEPGHSHDHGEYVMWHHIVALFALALIAGLGCALPMIVPDSNRTRFFVQLGKYFGAGVVLSVAFIHILPEALFALTHPCLSDFWTEKYPGMAPLIMMICALSMLVIEFMASSITYQVEGQNLVSGENISSSSSSLSSSSSSSPRNLESGRPKDLSQEFMDTKMSSPPVHVHDHDEHDHGHVNNDNNNNNNNNNNNSAQAASSSFATLPADADCHHAHGLNLLQCGPGVSTKVSTYMLEIGIALHSVFIGIALGVLSGPEFLAMTIAIAFHQFFEGIALGSRIAELEFKRRFLVPILLIIVFALVTPFGMAIGMGIHSTYDSESSESLIVMGICDAIAAGVLLYTAFVTLLGGDILFSERFRAESKKNKASYLCAVWVGAMVMAVLALWA